MNYGLPYKGSKNSIACDIIRALPKANNFYDLFAGGCSITHCAILAHKWGNIYFNDIDGKYPQLFLDAIKGKYHNEKRWISREDFVKEKDTNGYVAVCWSFGNNCQDYMYGKQIEPYKKAVWYAVLNDDYSYLWSLGINAPRVQAKTYREKKIKLCGILSEMRNTQAYGTKANLKQLQSLESLERLQRLQSLESLERLQSLENYSKSYEQIPIKENSLVYCDIPYENTSGYAGGFDHKRFYDWADKQSQLVVISSYEINDDRYKKVYAIRKSVTMQGGNNKAGKKYECLFINKKQSELWGKMKCLN